MHEFVIVGYGSAGMRHHRDLRELDCKVVAIADPRFKYKNVDTIMEDAFSGTIYYSNVTTCLLQHARNRVVVIASPTQKHNTQLALVRNMNTKAAFVEKPLFYFCPSVSMKVNMPIAVGHNYRFHPMIRKLKALINPDEKSLLTMIAYDDVLNWPNYSRDSWMAGQYGGCLLTSVSHSIDTALYLLGPVKQLACKMFYKKKIADSDYAVDLALKHECGAVTSIRISWDGPKTSTLSYIGNDYIGHFNLLRNAKDMHTNMMRSFLDYIDDKPSEICTLEEGLQVMRVIEVARKSNWRVKNV